MEKSRNAKLWVKEGYDLFAHEGHVGLHVEKIARKLQLNKSAFYHYFGDFDGYCAELLKMHHNKAGLFVQAIGELKTFDPAYLLLIVRHKDTILFQVQLSRDQKNPEFYEVSRSIDRRVNLAVCHLWSEYLDINCSTELTTRYYSFVRDKFYTRVACQNLNYQSLHELVSEAKSILQQLKHHKFSSGAGATLAGL